MLDSLKKYLFPVIVVMAAGAFLFLNNQHDDTVKIDQQQNPITETETEPPDSSDEATQPAAKVMVDVKGEIAQPGVFEIEPESRVTDVIQLAGGFTDDADQSMVNLAQKVQDEMVIMVPKTGEQMPAAAGTAGATSDKVQINRADQKDMETLNGIGPSKAASIIQYRDDNGPFKTADDLLDVSGIGEKTLESLQDDIQVP